ncbi:MAG: NfeD family protein [Acidobacteria bacterium]|nr:NfeD family protein [Acidobacteriota bacterium]
MSWWIWLSGGLLLLLAEMLTPGGFYFLFFGIGAVAAAIVALGTGSLTVQTLTFSAVSILSLVLFRKPLLAKLQKPGKTHSDDIAGEVAVVRTSLHPGDIGDAELRGTTWKARNISGVTIHAGARCTVEQVDGLTLNVREQSNA